MRSIATLLALGVLALAPAAHAGAKKDSKIPVTASSEEARQIYLKGRDLTEKLRATDARKAYEEAWAKDKTLAAAALGLANTANTAKEFWEALNAASALKDKLSDGERLQIEAAEAGGKNDPAGVRQALTKLVKAYPGDERAHNALATFHMGQQDYAAAIAEYKKAVAINPEFSLPYNMLGYAYKLTEKYGDSEAAFRKYIELIPGDPNPYDSLAELLMKTGRFEESIKQYEKALSVEPTFVSSYVGIGNDQIFLGKGDEARKTFAKLAQVARTEGERRTANFWMSQSYLFEGQTDKALAEMQKNLALSEAAKDLPTIAADHAVIGDILLEAGRADEALGHYKAQLDNLEKADVPPQVKEQAAIGWRYDSGRVAVARKDVAAAREQLAEMTKLVAVKKGRFNLFAQHELAGLIALEEKKYPAAIAELSQGNPQDPRVLYKLGLAYEGKGDAKKAKDSFTRAAEFNSFANSYPFVRKLAKDHLSRT